MLRHLKNALGFAPTETQKWLHIESEKHLSAGQSILAAGIPPDIILSLDQHSGIRAKARVQVGERVLKGQWIAGGNDSGSTPLHAPTSGTIKRITQLDAQNQEGLDGAFIGITTDALDEGLADLPSLQHQRPNPQKILERIHQCGIVGLGGATFPTAQKIEAGAAKLRVLIINGVECEPYLTGDDRLMRERSDEILSGAQILADAFGIPAILWAIEDDKPEALHAALSVASREPRLKVLPVPTRYPQGSERQLIQTILKEDLPPRIPPVEAGILCQNVATLTAIHQAVIFGRPLISRIVTVSGSMIASPANFEARIGTPIEFLIEKAGGLKGGAADLILGGPMTGKRLSSPKWPISKSTLGVIALPMVNPWQQGSQEMPCIRCGECAQICPQNLLPQSLLWHGSKDQIKELNTLNLMACIECGCCDWVCPSRIPLTPLFRDLKQAVRREDQKRLMAERSLWRHEARLARLNRESREKAESARTRKIALESGSLKIQDALERAQRKRQARQEKDANQGEESPP